MEKQIQKLEVTLVDQLKNLSIKKNEITIKVGQVHLEIKELTTLLNSLESEYTSTSDELDTLLAQLQQKYPSGEIDLLEGTVTF